MPGVNGIEATRQILATSPHIAVLVISMQEDDDSVFAALQAGARGYLLKGATRAEILRAIQAVAQRRGDLRPGDRAPPDAVLRRAAHQPAADAFPELTEREREILALVARGTQTNPEIARRLGLSPKTVRNHVSNIFTKLQVADRAQAIIRAREAGLGRSATRRRFRCPRQGRSGRPLGVGELAEQDQDQVDQVPDPAAAEGDQLQDAEAGVAEVEAVDAEAAEEPGEQGGHQPLAVGEQAGQLLAWNQPPPAWSRRLESPLSWPVIAICRSCSNP